MAKKLLIVEDDKNISYIITENAKIDGYECDAAYEGDDGLNKALNNIFAVDAFHSFIDLRIIFDI